MSDPREVAVVVPAFRAARFLPAAIESVLQQSHERWEMVVVDDGSDDETGAVATRYAAADSRVRYVRQENAGVSAARNRGATMTTAPYVAWLDADDVWLPAKLDACLARLGTDPDIGLVHSDLDVVDGSLRATGERLAGREGWVLEDLLLWDGTVVPGPGSSIVVPREVFLETGGFDPELSTAADQDFCIRVAARHRVARVPEVLGCYRVHPGSMHKRIHLMEADHLRVYDKATRAGMFHSAWFRRRCYSNLYMILAGSWWKDGRRPTRGLLFLARAMVMYPPNAWVFIRRRLKRIGRRRETA